MNKKLTFLLKVAVTLLVVGFLGNQFWLARNGLAGKDCLILVGRRNPARDRLELHRAESRRESRLRGVAVAADAVDPTGHLDHA